MTYKKTDLTGRTPRKGELVNLTDKDLFDLNFEIESILDHPTLTRGAPLARRNLKAWQFATLLEADRRLPEFT